MKFHEVTGSLINPVNESKPSITIAQLEDFIIAELVKLDPKNISAYENFSIRCKNLILKDILQALKSKTIAFNSDPEKILLVNKIFDTIELQFSILDELITDKITNKDLIVILSAIFITYFKKIIS